MDSAGKDKDTDQTDSQLTPRADASGGEGRDSNAIYQKGELVARVVNPEIDAAAAQIRFEEIYQSEHLLLPDDCEFQGHRIVIRKIGYSTKVDRGSEGKGRILREVTAQILKANGK